MTFSPTLLPDTPELRLLRVLDEAWSLLTLAWQGKKCSCPLGYYAPDVVSYFLRHWQELSDAAEGVSSSGMNPIQSRSSRDARKTLAVIRADLSFGTDRAFTSAAYLGWDAVYTIYARQGRLGYLIARRRELAWYGDRFLNTALPEPWKPLAEQHCIERISRSLGWVPHDVCDDNAA